MSSPLLLVYSSELSRVFPKIACLQRYQQKVIKETFALNEVPREAFLLGLAGLFPYAVTSLTTVYLAWDINHADMSGHGLFISGDFAQQALEYIQPLQIGYGAVVRPDIHKSTLLPPFESITPSV